MTTKKSMNLEKSLADLEKLVEELENGDLPLEKAMQRFEEGIRLTRGCQAALKEAEQRVQVLLRSSGGEDVLEDFLGEEDLEAAASGSPAARDRDVRERDDPDRDDRDRDDDEFS